MRSVNGTLTLNGSEMLFALEKQTLLLDFGQYPTPVKYILPLVS